MEGPTPSAEVVAEARVLLHHLAEWADDASAVDDDADGGVSVEFYGRKGCRLLLIVEPDGSAVYQETGRRQSHQSGIQKLASTPGNLWPRRFPPDRSADPW